MAVDLSQYDRVDYDPDNVGGTYYGVDDGEGHTDWYDEDGNLSASSETPDDEEEFQHKLEEWEKVTNTYDHRC